MTAGTAQSNNTGMFSSSVAHDEQMQAGCREFQSGIPAVSVRIFPAFCCAKGSVVLESVQYGPACGTLHGRSSVASILTFIRKSGIVFDDDATKMVGEAFDAACKELHDKGQPTIVYEVIAKRIIDAASNGERDPVQLRNVGLAGLGFDKGDKQAI